MGNFFSYAAAILVSIAVHVLVVGALLINWQPETERVIMQPQYIEASLVELAPKKKPQVNKQVKPKVDLAKKKREADQRRAAIKKKAAALKKEQEQALKAKKLEEKRAAESERTRMEAELLKSWRRKRLRSMLKRITALLIAIVSLFSSNSLRTGVGRPVLGATWRR